MPETSILSTCKDQHRRAVKLFQEGHYRESAQILEEVLKTGATSEIWNDWATAQLMSGQAAASERGYRCALSLDPANACAAGNLGVLLTTRGRNTDALPLLERAADKSSGRERDVLLGLIQTCRGRISGHGGGSHDDGSGDENQRSGQKDTEQRPVNPRHDRLPGETASLNGSVVACQPHPAICAVHPASDSASQRLTELSTAQPLQASADKAGMYFQGHIYGASGYAEEAWAVAVGVSERGIPTQLVPVGPTHDTKRLLPEASRRKLVSLQSQRVDLSRSVYLQFAVADAWDMDTCGRWCVVRTMFETDRLPDGVAERCNAMDEVWVPSRFNVETYARAGVKQGKLRLVPPGVDTQLFCPDVVPLQIPLKRGFNFVSIFDWHQRKGYDALLRAYLREFKPDEDVALILKVSQVGDALTDLQAEIACFIEHEAGLRLEAAAAVILVNGFIPQHKMPSLYAASDCFVLPTRGEGYCRPFFEALSCEVPVIATGWSGQTDFLNQENSYPLEYRLVPVPDDVDREIYAGHRWAEPEVDHLRQLMRQVFSNPEEARRRAVQGRADMVWQYDWSVVIPQWVAELRRLLG